MNTRAKARFGVKLVIGLVLIGLAIGLTGLYRGGANFVAARNGDRAPLDPDTGTPFRFECGDIAIDTWVVAPEGDAAPGAVDTAIVLHGKADHKGSMLGLGQRFARDGVRAVLVDLRGHGRSSAVPITYGARERHDLSCMLDGFERRGVDLGEIGVYGASYGGAVALQFAGHEPRVARVVAVAAFRSFDAIGRSMIELPSPLQSAVIASAGFAGGFDPDDASPEAIIGETHADVVLVYGRDDEIVPFAHGEAVASECGDRCRLVVYEGRSHLQMLSNAPLRDLLHRHLAARPFPPVTESP
ncbi:MAG: alpha/beta fold hydrolase [Myxococcota bacterium]